MASMNQVQHLYLGSLKSLTDEMKIISYSIMLHDGVQLLGLGFKNLCSSSSTRHFSPSVLQDLHGEMELLRQTSHLQCFLGEMESRIKLLATFRYANFGIGIKFVKP